MRPKFLLNAFIFLLSMTVFCQPAVAQSERSTTVNEPVDISPDFKSFTNAYFLADSLSSFNSSEMSGTVKWQRNRYSRRMAFNNEIVALYPANNEIFPATEYEENPELPFSIQFVSPRAIRLRMNTGRSLNTYQDSLMLVKEPATDASWTYKKVNGAHVYTSTFGSVTIREYPWHIEIRNAKGELLTETFHAKDNSDSYTPIMPFSFLQRSSDLTRSIAASFTSHRKKRSLDAENLLPVLISTVKKLCFGRLMPTVFKHHKCISRFRSS